MSATSTLRNMLGTRYMRCSLQMVERIGSRRLTAWTWRRGAWVAEWLLPRAMALTFHLTRSRLGPLPLSLYKVKAMLASMAAEELAASGSGPSAELAALPHMAASSASLQDPQPPLARGDQDPSQVASSVTSRPVVADAVGSSGSAGEPFFRPASASGAALAASHAAPPDPSTQHLLTSILERMEFLSSAILGLEARLQGRLDALGVQIRTTNLRLEVMQREHGRPTACGESASATISADASAESDARAGGARGEGSDF